MEKQLLHLDNIFIWKRIFYEKPPISCSFFSTISPTALAGAMGPVQEPVPFVSTLSVGPTWTQIGTTQNLFIIPAIEKTYAANKPTSTMVDGELFAGLRKTWTTNVSTHLGIAINTTEKASLNGWIWDDAQPEFNNYTYSYSIRHQSVALAGKVLVDPGYWVIPWVKASVGVGFNQAYGFVNQPVDYTALPNNNFLTHTTTAFTYTVGAGVQKAINTHWQVGVGYEFADWGKSRLNPSFEQTVGTGPVENHLYTNGVLFNITYLA